MEKFTNLTAMACPLDMASVDTDQLIPARFMTRSRAEGYGRFLLHDLRFAGDGTQKPDFVLNQPRFAGAQIMVSAGNFGTGSSREAAVYALQDYGIRCVIAPSFGDIFSSNSVKNGLLTALVSDGDARWLLCELQKQGAPKLVIDLESQTILGIGRAISFEIDAARRLQLLNGWEDMDLTLQYSTKIAEFKRDYTRRYDWVTPRDSGI